MQNTRQNQTAQTAPAQGDTVKLSAGAQAQQLLEQGQSVNEIAEDMGLSSSLIDSYLGITTASTTSTPVAQPATHAAQPAAALIPQPVAAAAVTGAKLA